MSGGIGKSFAAVLTLLLWCAHTQATTVAELQSANRLQLRSWLVPPRNAIPGQQIKLHLEIATDRWFTGGTRIQIPEVPGLVILQTDSFASNSSEQRNGENWVVQRWTLEVYPQRAGDFTIPAITSRIKVSADDGTTAEGDIASATLRFAATRPEGLARASHWVAAPDYSVSQTFDRPLEELEVGDAIEREVVFAASESMAMMLPAFKEPAISGLTAYPEPPVLDNRNNRGTSEASRVQRITYIIEAEGQYQLPAQDFFWWDTGSAELQLLSLPTVDIVVGDAATASVDAPPPTSRLWGLLPWAAGFILLATLAWLVGKLPVAALVRAAAAAVKELQRRCQIFRKPALAGKLNPGNSVAD